MFSVLYRKLARAAKFDLLYADLAFAACLLCSAASPATLSSTLMIELLNLLLLFSDSLPRRPDPGLPHPFQDGGRFSGTSLLQTDTPLAAAWKVPLVTDSTSCQQLLAQLMAQVETQRGRNHCYYFAMIKIRRFLFWIVKDFLCIFRPFKYA